MRIFLFGKIVWAHDAKHQFKWIGNGKDESFLPFLNLIIKWVFSSSNKKKMKVNV